MSDFKIQKIGKRGNVLHEFTIREIEDVLTDKKFSAIISYKKPSEIEMTIGYVYKETARGWTIYVSELFGQRFQIFCSRSEWIKKV